MNCNPKDLDCLLEQLCLDALTADETATLETFLADSPKAQRRYVEVVHMREALAYLLSHESSTSDPLTADVTSASESTGRLGDDPGPGSPVAVAARQRTRFRSWLPAWGSAAAIGIMCLGVASPVAYRLGAQNARETQRVVPARPASSAPALPFAQATHLGQISGLSLDASAHGLLRSMQVGQELRCGEVVQLSSGFIRLQLNAGPQLILEGPAEFSLVGDDRVFVRAGRVGATEGPHLVVQTPLLTAECREAATSLDIADDDSARVYVTAGVVTLYSTPQEGSASEELRVLHSGEGLLIQPGSQSGVLSAADSGPLTSVMDSWEKVEARLRPYERLVLEDRPIAYWPLYQVRKNRRVLDLTQNGFDGLPVGNWPSESPVSNLDEQRGAYFNGECYIEPDRKPPFKPQSGFAIEGWARVEGGPQFQSVFTSRWVLRSHEPDCQMYGFTLYAGDQDNWEFWSGNGRKGQVWQELVSPATVRRGKWAHVVASFVPSGRPNADEVEGTVHLYVDGQHVAEGVHHISLTEFEWPARIGAAEFVPRYLTSWLFQGELRDIALYDYPLEAVEIKEHYDIGKSASAEHTSALPRATNWLSASVEGARR